jgi:serine/threonine-protein kinase HipA
LTGRTLEVWCFGQRAGTLTDNSGELTFAYDPAWRAAGRPPLSQALPLDGPFNPEAVVAFFGGLLPEGTPRRVVARQLGVSVGNDFALLEALAGDTAGAVSLVRPGEPAPPESMPDELEWLDEDRLAQEIAELPRRPMHTDEEGEYRLSLAGAQDKLPVVMAPDGTVGLTRGHTPSTHIMKTPIDGLPGTVANEALCLDLGNRLGVRCAQAVPRRARDRECLLVTRYDREATQSGTRRLHQEDFCQALGVPSERKYQSEGGPGIADCFELVRSAVLVPADDAVRLLDSIGLSFLVGNHDAHGKNFSLLYEPGAERPRLAPAYDILSTIVYRKVQPMSRRMAMKWGSENRPDYVRARHLDAVVDAAGLAPAAARRRLRGLAERAPEAVRDARAELAQRGWDAPILDDVVALVDDRAGRLEEIAAPQSRPRARPR